MSFQLRRGTDVVRATITFAEGELIYVTDTQKVWVGDGITLGAIDLMAAGHNHNSLYYLQGQVDTFINNLDVSRQVLLDAHTNDLTIHRTINDVGSGATDLWSAQRIETGLLGKADVIHNHNTLYYTQTQIDADHLAINADIALGEVKVDTDDVAADVLINKVTGGQGINAVKDATGPDNVLQINAEIFLATINGQPKPAYVDSSKGGKVLTCELMNMLYAEAAVGNNEWIQIAHATDALSAYIMPFDGTLVGVTAMCEQGNGNTKAFRLIINGTQITANLFTLSGGGNIIINDQTLNIDFVQGDRIRLRAGGGGTIQDTVITLFAKWRA